MNKLPKWITVYRDRYDEDYQRALSELLEIENLKKTSDIAYSSGLHSKKQKRITLKFSGLSSLSLLGGAENHFRNENKTSKAFKNLLLNTQELDNDGYVLDIELLFSYPYSDFNYNLILGETARQDGFSVECLRNNKNYDPNFYTPQKLNLEDLIQANTFANLKTSLKRLQDYIILANKKRATKNNSEGAFNSKEANHRVVVKFSVLNIMTCFLKINNHIFIDPYTYSKNQCGNEILNLSSPLTHIVLNTDKEWIREMTEQLSDEEKLKQYELHKDHFLSLIGHFRYLWHHPLSVTSHDATYLTRGTTPTLGKFKNPLEVNFDGKATAIKAYLKSKQKLDASDSEIDLWKQYIKNEFLRHCSKFLIDDTKEVDETNRGQIKLTKIPVFIVGAWKKGDLNNYMKLVKDFFENPIKSADLFSKETIKEFNLIKFIEKYFDLNTDDDLRKEVAYEDRKKIKKLFNSLLMHYYNLTLKYKKHNDHFARIIAERILTLTNAKEQKKEHVTIILSKVFEDEIAIRISDIIVQNFKKTNPNTEEIKSLIITELHSIFSSQIRKNTREKKDYPKNTSGLEFKPILIDTDDTEEIRQTIYRNLNQSQLGFVIQTNDIYDSPFHEKISEEIKEIFKQKEIIDLSGEVSTKILSSIEEFLKKEYYSKPNVYLEKGYLMGKLGKRKDRAGREIEAVCVFKEVQSHTESDNITFTHTSFSNYREFKVQLYRVIKWIWNITEVNSDYCIEIQEILKKIIFFKDTCQDLYNFSEGIPSIKKNMIFSKSKGLLLTEDDKKINYQRHSYKISSFINEINTWHEKFTDRYWHNFEFYYKHLSK